MKKRDLGTELCVAIFKADFEKFKQLLDEGADVNAVGDRRVYSVAEQTPLWETMKLAGEEISTHWIEFWKALSEGYSEILPRDHAHKRRCFVAIAKILIERGADLEKKCYGTTPLRGAVYHRDVEMVQLLLAKGANPNAESFSILSKLARREGRKTTLGYYSTLLHEAVEKNAPPIVRALLEAGADIRCTDHEGKTPLEIAREKGYTEIVDILVDAEAKA